MRLVLHGRDLPGVRCGPYSDVHVGLQVGREPDGLVRGDAAGATWETEVVVVRTDDGLDVRGPAVHGRRGERFLYLTWGELRDGRFTMFRRAKLMLADLGPGAATATLAEATVGLTDSGGMPRCARVRDVAWALSG